MTHRLSWRGVVLPTSANRCTVAVVSAERSDEIDHAQRRVIYRDVTMSPRAAILPGGRRLSWVFCDSPPAQVMSGKVNGVRIGVDELLTLLRGLDHPDYRAHQPE